MTTLVQEWRNFVIRLAHTPELVVAGVQRIHRDVRWDLDPEVFFDGSLTLESTGYTEAKIKALKRNYLNLESIQRARKDLAWRIEHRKYGSGGWNFNGQKKRGTKQDFCIRAGVISYYPQRKATSLSVYWRTAELIKRFRGDLIFLRDIVLPMFDLSEAPLESITFNFANVTVHPMFFVLLIEHLPGWHIHLEQIKRNNPRMYKSICYWCWRYLCDTSKSIDSYSSARQVRMIAGKTTSTKTLERFTAYINREVRTNARDYSEAVQQHYEV